MNIQMNRKSINSNNIIDIIIYFILGIVTIAVAYPLWFILMASISDPTMVNSGQVVLFPKEITIEGYNLLISHKDIWVGYRNTVFYSLTGTAIGVVITMMVSYTLSVKNFKGGKFIMVFLMITLYFNGGLIPTYILMKNMNLLNTPLIMVYFIGMIILEGLSIYRVKSYIPFN